MSKRLPITRESAEDGFVYRRGGRRVTAAAELKRLESLAVPPAWTDVELAASSRAKVLARGIDDAGRAQSIYGSAWRHRRDREKFDRTLEFARLLPKLRAQVDRDLRRTKVSSDRVIACILRLIDLELFRVGSAAYAKEHDSFGVTTLRQRHVRVSGATVEFDYSGKGGKRHRRTVRDRRIARTVSRLLDLPAGDLFRFLDDEGDTHSVGSRRVNEYLQKVIGSQLSVKDFRTWGATVDAVTGILAIVSEPPGTVTEGAVRSVVEAVAERLGNTPAVARYSYIDPRVLDIQASADAYAKVRRDRGRMRERRHQSVDEQCAITLLKRMAH